MKIEIPLFSENLDIESLDWVYEVAKFLTWLTSLKRSMSSLQRISSREEELHGGNKSHEDAKASHP